MKKIIFSSLVIFASFQAQAHTPAVVNIGYEGFGYYPFCTKPISMKVPEEKDVNVLRQRKEWSPTQSKHTVDVIITDKYDNKDHLKTDMPNLGIYSRKGESMNPVMEHHQWHLYILTTVSDRNCWNRIQTCTEDNRYYQIN